VHSTAAAVTRAFVLHPDLKSGHNRRLPEPRLAEAVALAAALPNIAVVGGEVVPVARIQPATLFGSGKVAELKARFAGLDVDLVLVDGPVARCSSAISKRHGASSCWIAPA